MRAALAIVLGFAALPLQAAHPLLTEETGTQGAGNLQLEVNYDAVRDRTAAGLMRSSQVNTILSYGITETLDVQIGLPYLRRSTDTGTGSTVARGGGDAAIDFKWRFFERDGFSIGLKPGGTLASGDAQRRLGQGRNTYRAILIFDQKSDGLDFNGHLGIRRNSNTVGERPKLYEISAATLYQAAAKTKLILEMSVSRQPDPALRADPATALLGFIYSPAKSLDLDAGLRRALNHAAADRGLGAGLTVRW